MHYECYYWQAGGLDSLTLNSLYDDAAYRASQQQQSSAYGMSAPNPFEVADPFSMSNTIPPPPSVQMAAAMAQPQINPFGPFPAATYPPPQQHNPQNLMMGAQNPFGDATGFGAFPVNSAGHQQTTTNPFGSTGLL